MNALMTRNELAPWNGLRDLEDRINRMFNDRPLEPQAREANWIPAIDVHEDEEAYTLEADLPGLTRDDIQLTVQNDVVTLKGTRKQEREDKREGYRRVERRYGSFQRAFRLRGGVDAKQVDAHFENGVLRVRLPKPEETKPRQIDVKIS